MEQHREFDATVAACLLTLSEKIEELQAELTATRMVLGVALMHADQSAILQTRAVVADSDDLTLNLQMTEIQREVFQQRLQSMVTSVETGQASMYPDGLRGILVGASRYWLNLRRALVGAPWRGGILRGLALRWWTLGTASKPVRPEAMRGEVLARARSGSK